MTDKTCEVVWAGWEKKQYKEKLCSPQALSKKTDAPQLGVYVLQVSTANGCFGSVPARGMQCLFINHSLLTHCFGTVPAREMQCLFVNYSLLTQTVI